MPRESRTHVPLPRRRYFVAAAALLVGAGTLLSSPDTASAGLGASSAPQFPTTIRLGATGVPVSIKLTNQNTDPNVDTPTRVCNFGDALPCPAGDPGIVLTPSCGLLGLETKCDTPDPGVFRLSTTGTGAPRTECAGMPFTITEIDPAAGMYRFTPDGGAHVQFAGTGSVCRIDFTVDMLRMPLVDWQPAVPGLQTVQVAASSIVADNGLTAFSRGTSQGVTALRAQPAIATAATTPVEIDGLLADTATVTGLVLPVPGATVTFNLYGVDDPTCAAAPVHTSTVPLQPGSSASTGTATAAPYASNRVGELRWIATYNGDAHNEPVSGVCSDPSELATVVRHRPAIATVASVPPQVGTEMNDVATVSGLLRPAADATVTFRLYGPDDASCVTEPAATSTVPLVLDASGTSGTATATAFSPSAPGVYRWIATYNGDATNEPVSGTCGDPTETVMVTRTKIPAGTLPETR